MGKVGNPNITEDNKKTRFTKGSERAKAASRKGLAKRLSNKPGREAALAVLALPVGKEEAELLKDEFKVSGKMTHENAADLAMLRRAKLGDNKAFTALMKKAGLMTEMQDIRLEADTVVRIKPLTAKELKAFKDKFDEEF